MDKNYNDYNNLNIKKRLKPNYSFFSSKNKISNKYSNNNNINVNNNVNIQLLKEKIKSQKSNIEYLENRLLNYDETINEVTRLNLELNKMNEILQSKNKTILEYQNLSEISKAKFKTYINKTNQKKEKIQKNLKNYDDLESKNRILLEQIKLIEKENNTLKHQLNSIQNKNIYEIDHIKNEMDLINIEYEKEKKQNQLVNDEKIKKNKEIIDLKTKLITCDKFKEEIDNINNKYKILEQQMNEKNKTIEELTNLNNDLKDKLDISNENYNQVVYEQKNLEMKLNNLIDKVKQYEIILKNNNDNNINKSVINDNNIIRQNFDNNDINDYSHMKYPIRNKSIINFHSNLDRYSKSPNYISKKNNYEFNYSNYLIK